MMTVSPYRREAVVLQVEHTLCQLEFVELLRFTIIPLRHKPKLSAVHLGPISCANCFGCAFAIRNCIMLHSIRKRHPLMYVQDNTISSKEVTGYSGVSNSGVAGGSGGGAGRSLPSGILAVGHSRNGEGELFVHFGVPPQGSGPHRSPSCAWRHRRRHLARPPRESSVMSAPVD